MMIQNASDEAIQLIQDMLQYDPAKRPTVSECLQYPFFRVRVPIPLNAPDMTDEEQFDAIIDNIDNMAISIEQK